MKITKDTVRKSMLAAQGLLASPNRPAKPEDLLPTIRRMQYLQIDTIHIVHRSQHLVLWSRLGDFEPEWLDDLHRSGALFEYYAHALCYLPLEDYPIFRGRMLHDDRVGNGWHRWASENPEVIQRVRGVIREQGPVCSADFDSETVPTGWGDVKQEKLALQRMFSTGELMVPYREKFQRYYDLRERVLPDWSDSTALDARAAKKALLLKAAQALGAAKAHWMGNYYALLKTGLDLLVKELTADGHLLQVEVEGWEEPGYVHPDQMALVEGCAGDDLQPTHTTLLSPFDPLISDRDRAREVFNFDYKMESFTPVKDRQYGYFCLPILHRGELVGRLDPKAHRQRKLMEIKKIYLEPGVRLTDGLGAALKDTLAAFTAWHGLESYKVSAADSRELIEALA